MSASAHPKISAIYKLLYLFQLNVFANIKFYLSTINIKSFIMFCSEPLNKILKPYSDYCNVPMALNPLCLSMFMNPSFTSTFSSIVDEYDVRSVKISHSICNCFWNVFRFRIASWRKVEKFKGTINESGDRRVTNYDWDGNRRRGQGCSRDHPEKRRTRLLWHSKHGRS